MKPGNPRKKGGLPGFLFRGGGISALVKKGGITPRRNDRPGEGNGTFWRGKRGLSGTFSGGVQKRLSTPIIIIRVEMPQILGIGVYVFWVVCARGSSPRSPAGLTRKKI